MHTAHAADANVKPLDKDEIQEITKTSQDIRGRVGTLTMELERLRGTYVKPVTRESGITYYKKRFSQAKALFDVEDYQHAAIMLLDILERPEVESQEELKYQVLYYLGESLFMRQNSLMAKRYMHKVVDYGEKGEHYTDAVVRLIQIAVDVNDLDAAKKIYSLLTDGNVEVGDMIKYALGKYLYSSQKIDEALDVLNKIGQSSPYYLRAQYLLGAVYVDQSMARQSDMAKMDGELTKAAEQFERVVKGPGSDPETDTLVRQMAQINIGRILHERAMLVLNSRQEVLDARREQRIAELNVQSLGVRQEETLANEVDGELASREQTLIRQALRYYRLIPYESPFYDQAFYELVWIYIRRGNFDDALNNLEIMLGSMPDSMYAPEAQLTKAEILAKLKEYRKAKIEYHNVVDMWEGVVGILDRLTDQAQGRNASQVQKEIMEQVKQLPLVAFKWLKQEEQIGVALAMEEELKDIREQVEATRKVLDKLVYAAQQKKKANAFPVLQEGREHGLNVLNSTVDIESALLRLHQRLTAGRLDEQTRNAYEDARKTRSELEQRYDNLPKTEQERDVVKQQKIERIEELGNNVYRLELTLKGLDEKLNNLLVKKEQMRLNPRSSKRFLSKVEAQLIEERTQMQTMLAELAEVSDLAGKEIQAVKMGSGETEEEAVRREFEAAMAKEQELLQKVRQGMTAGEQNLLNELGQLRTDSANLKAKVDTYLEDLEVLGASWMQEFDQEIQKYQVVFNGYRRDMERLEEETAKTASSIVVANLKNVRQHFYSIVLDADVGLIEIAWDQWDEVNSKLEETRAAKAKKLEEMEKEFKEHADILDAGTGEGGL